MTPDGGRTLRETGATDRLRVALLADDFNPEWPSLPVVGFKTAVALAAHADVTVFTHVRNRPNLEKLAPLPFAIVYIDNEYIARPMNRFSTWLRGGAEVAWTIQIASKYLPYLEFERLAGKVIAEQDDRFDVVHRVTPMTPTLPSFAAGRVGVPFVLGPLNGNLAWPRAFMAEQKRERETFSKFRSAYKLLPFYRATYRRAAAILAAFPHTVADLDEQVLDRVIDMPEIGYDESIFHAAGRRSRGERLTFLYAGRLVPYKLPEITVQAFAARPELRQHRLRIVGSGPEEPRLREIVETHGLHDCVEFAGRLSQSEVAEEMRRADIFFFPSIRELGAGVVVEALACGLPCLVADYGAPGALVDDNRGRALPIGTKDIIATRFADAAVAMAADRPSLDAKSDAAARYALSHFTWDQKARAMVEVYQWVLRRRAEKPVFSY